MANPVKIPDTIFASQGVGSPGFAAPAFAGGRLMSDGPHTDGLFICPADNLGKDSANLVLTRNAKGDWSLNRTAAGAETYNIRATLQQILRLGETYEFGEVGSQNMVTPADKGIEVIDIFALYNVGVATLTSATLRLGKTVYSTTPAGGAFVQTDLQAAGAISTALVTAGQYAYQKLAVITPVFHKDDLGLIEVEAVIVMQNTGTLKFAGLGAHVQFNYN